MVYLFGFVQEFPVQGVRQVWSLDSTCALEPGKILLRFTVPLYSVDRLALLDCGQVILGDRM